MEAACNFLLNTLRESPATALTTIDDAHRARDNPFDLDEVIPFLPDRHHPDLCALLHAALAPSLSFFSVERPANDPPAAAAAHLAAVRVTADAVILLVHGRARAPPTLRALIIALHAVLLRLPPSPAQNAIARACEWLWGARDAQRDDVVPQTLLFLLLRSFGDEALQLDGEARRPRRGADVRRVFAIRKAFNVLALGENVPEAVSIRNLLLRCATSATYLREPEGRKFLAFLLSIEDIRGAVFNVLLAQLASVRKVFASLFGNVFLIAWKTNRADWLVDSLKVVAEKAILAGVQPFSTNLRTVLASFHANKRTHGVELLLHSIYAPVLYSNLMVANPIVRRNAITILADAFPIHDPGSSMEEIQNAVAKQCGKLLDLLQDPAPSVRRAAVEGVCRVLGLFSEIVPDACARKMVDFITGKLAFDASSAAVRVAVFEGLEFILRRNHLARPLLVTVLPPLGVHVHDSSEKVRLSFLDLLSTVKSLRIRELRYFDIVPVDDLLLRLPQESNAVSAKILSLIATSYFPLERSGKSAEEIAASQTRAYFAMVGTSEDAAMRFYKQINMYVPPGPLVEFAMRLTTLALDAPLREMSESKKQKQKKVSRRRNPSRRRRGKENMVPEDDGGNVQENEDDNAAKTKKGDVPREIILTTVADVLVSMLPSLSKERNANIRELVDSIFGGEALKPYLIERGNSKSSRAACWRIASCISPGKLKPLTILWRQTLDEVLDWSHDTFEDVQAYHTMLSSLMLCGSVWKRVSVLLAVISGWADCASSGMRTSRVGYKVRKKSQSTLGHTEIPARINALFGLQTIGSILLEDSEVGERFGKALVTEDDDGDAGAMSCSCRLLSALRKGFSGALEHMLESDAIKTLSTKELAALRHILMRTFTKSMSVSLTLSIEHGQDVETFAEFLEMLTMLDSEDLWVKTTKMDSALSTSLAAEALSFCADAIAVRDLEERDYLLMERVAGLVAKHVTPIDADGQVSLSLELLRISYHLAQKGSLADETDETSSALVAIAKQKQLSLRIAALADEIVSGLTDDDDDEEDAVPASRKALRSFAQDVLEQHQDSTESDSTLRNLDKISKLSSESSGQKVAAPTADVEPTAAT